MPSCSLWCHCNDKEVSSMLQIDVLPPFWSFINIAEISCWLFQANNVRFLYFSRIFLYIIFIIIKFGKICNFPSVNPALKLGGLKKMRHDVEVWRLCCLSSFVSLLFHVRNTILYYHYYKLFVFNLVFFPFLLFHSGNKHHDNTHISAKVSLLSPYIHIFFLRGNKLVSDVFHWDYHMVIPVNGKSLIDVFVKTVSSTFKLTRSRLPQLSLPSRRPSY